MSILSVRCIMSTKSPDLQSTYGDGLLTIGSFAIGDLPSTTSVFSYFSDAIKAGAMTGFINLSVDGFKVMPTHFISAAVSVVSTLFTSYRDREKLSWRYYERAKEGIMLYPAILHLRNLGIGDDPSFENEFRMACTGILLKVDILSSNYRVLLKSERSFFHRVMSTEAADDLVDVENLSRNMRLQVQLLALEEKKTHTITVEPAA